MSETPAGILFLVATPIGNLDDISLRAIRVLRRGRPHRGRRHPPHSQTAAPLRHPPPHDEPARAQRARESAGPRRQAPRRRPHRAGHRRRHAGRLRPRLPARPGRHRRRAFAWRRFRAQAPCWRRSCRPGSRPTASCSRAFLPRRRPRDGPGSRPSKAGPRTLVFFEAPHRIKATLETALDTLGDREASLGRELTKLHEEIIRGPLSAVLGQLGEPRGEFTVVVAGRPDVSLDPKVQVSDNQLLAEFGHLTENGNGPPRGPQRTGQAPQSTLARRLRRHRSRPPSLTLSGPFANVAPLIPGLSCDGCIRPGRAGCPP